MKTFAERLTAAIEATRETHAEIARSTEMPIEMIVGFCNGAPAPSIQRVQRLAEFFGCSPDWLLNGTVAAGRAHNLVRELELAAIDSMRGVVTLQPDDYGRIYTLACMSK